MASSRLVGSSHVWSIRHGQARARLHAQADWLNQEFATHRRTRETAHAYRYGKYGLHAALLQPRDAHDTGLGLLLRRPRRQEERHSDHDPELRLPGLDGGALGVFGLFLVLLR